ncbi:flagellar hook-associated protein FlgL [Paenibacillus turicensis]|uniref:flagellar hook-associated protein FlgL n=1 Tax=Paenibacillus turicensis TaxID=160487 RepID=UPI003D2D920F
MIRVTSNMLNNQMLLNLNRNGVNLNNLQTQLTTGRKINKPSDDPVGITYSMRYRAELSSNDQYQKNVSTAQSWLEYTDTAVGQVGDILHRVKELTVQASNSTNPQSALDSINTEIKQLKEQLIDIGNSKINGKYIFNGQTYDKKPYDFPKGSDNQSDTTLAGDITTDTGEINYFIGDNIQLSVNVTGSDIFGNPSEKNSDHIFTMLDRLSTALEASDFDTISDQLDLVNTRLDKVLTARSQVGAKTNRVDLMQGRLSDLEINLNNMQGSVEDADYEKVLLNSKIQESIYNASLSTGAKIISNSLADFLR